MLKQRRLSWNRSSSRHMMMAKALTLSLLMCVALIIRPTAAQVGRPLPCAVDVSAQVKVSYGDLRQGFQKVVLQNISKEDLTGPVTLVLDQLKAGVTLENSDGVTRCAEPTGSPYILLDVGDDDEFTSGEEAEVSLECTDESANILPLTYATRVLAGFGLR